MMVIGCSHSRFISFHSQSERLTFSSAIDAARQETENFLGKVYGGSLGLMMSAMVESRRLTEADVAERL